MPYFLSHPQKRIYFTENTYYNTPMHNIGGYMKFDDVDYTVLKRALNALIKVNDGLRLTIYDLSGEPKQNVQEYSEVDFPFFDFSDSDSFSFEKWVQEEFTKPISFENYPLFLFALFKIDEKRGGFLAKVHHIITDGWSFELIGKQTILYYTQLLESSNVEFEPNPSYLEYLKSEKKYLDSDRFQRNKSFWMEKFNSLNEYFMQKNNSNINGNRKSFKLESHLSLKLKETSQKTKISLNTIFVSGMACYLYKTTGQRDIVIGTPVLNRTGKREKNMIGMFTSSMPLRISINEDQDISSFLKDVNSEIMTCYLNQKYPYDILIKDLELKNKGFDGLFDICVNYYNTNMSSNINGLDLSINESYSGCQYYGMQVVIRDWQDSENIGIDFDYRIDEYDLYEIEKAFEYLTNILQYIADGENIKLKDIQIISTKDLEKIIYGYNSFKSSYPMDKSIHKLIEEQAQRVPNKTALYFENQSMSYSELNKVSNQLAGKLREEGVFSGKIVALLTHHSFFTIIGILGVLKAGGAYLPIDPSTPDERISFMLEDSQVEILLTTLDLPVGVNFRGKTICLQDEKIYEGKGENLPSFSTPKDIAYVIYTSGSTGKPKGVIIEHGSLVNYIWWARKMYVRNEDESFALYSSISFDLTVTSVFTPLTGGNSIYIYHNYEDEFILYKIMRENKVNIIKLTPAHLSLLKEMNNTNSSVKRFIVGGEDLKSKLCEEVYKSFSGNIEIYNEYGPTETTVGCMIHKYDSKTDNGLSVPIGKPADNTQIYLLDEDLKPVPEGMTGEMFISGDGVARGYLNRDSLTKERFIDNPFVKNTKMYRTGDIARFVREGVLGYIGRKDFQVKIKGFRIETGEIEKTLLDVDGITQAVVIDKCDLNGNKYLCAYVVADENIKIPYVKKILRKKLPHYMIPQHIIEIEFMPLTGNGKVNRNSLPEPDVLSTVDTDNYVPPENSTEEKIAEVFQNVLGIKKIGMEDDFFSLGGDSIKAMQISSKLTEVGIKVKVRDILEDGGIRKLVGHAILVGNNENIYQDIIEGEFQGTPIFKWFLSQELPDSNYYNQSVILGLSDKIQEDWINEALILLIKHHDSLRINYNRDNNTFYYNNDLLKDDFCIERIDLSNYDTQTQDINIKETCENVRKSFNINNGHLLKACIFHLGKGGKRLFISIHHLGVDGISWRILLSDLANILKEKIEGKEYVLPPKTLPCIVWEKALKEYSVNVAASHKNYWDDVLQGMKSFPDSIFNPVTEEINFITEAISISDSEFPCLIEGFGNSGVKMEEVLLSSLITTMYQYIGCETFVIEMEGHGREEISQDINITRTIGWFTSIFPVKFSYMGEEPLRQIYHVKEQLGNLPDKGLSFGVLKYMQGMYEDYRQEQLIRFNYLGQFSEEYESNIMYVSNEDTGLDVSINNPGSSFLEINAMSVDGCLRMDFQSKRFSNKFMFSEFVDDYIHNLKKNLSLNFSVEEYGKMLLLSTTVNLSSDDMDELFV